MKYFFAVISIFALCSFSSAAMAGEKDYNADAGESYAAPTFRDMAQLVFELGSVDVTKSPVIDDYAKLMYCALYKQKFSNEFEWDKIRSELSNKLRLKKNYYRTLYELDGSIDLDRYDFNTQDFPLTADTALSHVGSMVLYDLREDADEQGKNVMCVSGNFGRTVPNVYMIRFTVPLNLDRLKLDPDSAQKLLNRMQSEGDKARRLWVRFRMRVTGYDSLAGGNGQTTSLLTLHGELIGVDLFYDQKMTKWMQSVYVARP